MLPPPPTHQPADFSFLVSSAFNRWITTEKFNLCNSSLWNPFTGQCCLLNDNLLHIFNLHFALFKKHIFEPLSFTQSFWGQSKCSYSNGFLFWSKHDIQINKYFQRRLLFLATLAPWNAYFCYFILIKIPFPLKDPMYFQSLYTAQEQRSYSIRT